MEISTALVEIGSAARLRRAVDPSVFALVERAAVQSPLSPEPFLVRGIQAQIRGNLSDAEAAFRAAQWRDPRSMPAAYFLANYYFRTGRTIDGLRETALLARLSPGGAVSVTPFVAAYAADAANWPKLRILFRSQPELEEGVLDALAHDPRNTGAIFSIADANHRRADSAWLPILLNSLVSSHDYARAHQIWANVAGTGAARRLVYDANFSSVEAPPPFNWALTSSSIGVAERQPGRRLHVIFYGNADGVLASQLLLLPAGTYRMQLQLVGSPVDAAGLQWSIRCDTSPEPVTSASLDNIASHGWTFQIAADCPAQWLELSGRSGDVAQQSDVTMTGLTLEPVGAGA